MNIKDKTQYRLQTSYFVFLAPHVQYDGLVILISRDGDHAGLAVVPVHGHGGVAPMLKSKKKYNLSDF